MPAQRHLPSLLAILLLPLLAACGSSSSSSGGGGPPPPTIIVDAINAPLFTDLSTAFVVEGSGFGTAGDFVLVRFETVIGQGTPFSNGTSEFALVEAYVLNNNQCVGLSPPALSPGSFTCYVDVIIGNAEGLSPDPIGTFIRAPAIPNVEYFPIMAPDAETSIIVNGTPDPDILIGTAGADELFGFESNDFLDGLDGNDDYTDGLDLDAFVVDILPGDTDETFIDFTPADDIMLTFGDPGDVLFSVIEPIAAVTDDGFDVVMVLTGGGTIRFDGIGDGGILDLAELLFAGVKLVISLP